MSINREVIKEWVKALRSGEYKQGTIRLRNDANEYCCLGVLCDILEVPAVFDEEQKAFSYDGLFGILSRNVQMKMGFDGNYNSAIVITFPDPIKFHIYGTQNITLTDLNDNGFTFNQIADIIEWYFL